MASFGHLLGIVVTITAQQCLLAQPGVPVRREASRHLGPSSEGGSRSSSDLSLAGLLQPLLESGQKPWFNDTSRKHMRELVRKDGGALFGSSLKNRWLVGDGVLTEDECKQLRDHMDKKESETWTREQELDRYTAKLGDTIRTHNWFALHTPHVVLPRCMNDEKCQDKKVADLFLKTRRLMTAAARTFFGEAHMIHPELTTMQRRSMPLGEREKKEIDYWDVHQGVHADSCQINLDAEVPYCKSVSDKGFLQRSHTAVLYLNGYDLSSGGELFLTDTPHYAPPKEKRLPIPLKCGRLVVFESGPQNLHGVNKLLNGSRYAVDMWMTTIPAHYEYAGRNQGVPGSDWEPWVAWERDM